MINKKPPNKFIDILLTASVLFLLILLICWAIGSIIALLWNFIMPVLGLPQLSTLQALAFYFLFKILTAEFKRPKKSKQFILNIEKEDNDGIGNPTNKYPS